MDTVNCTINVLHRRFRPVHDIYYALLRVLVPSGLQYKSHQIPTIKRFSYCLVAFFAESLEARCQVENEDVVGAAPTGDAPTTSEWSAILLPTNVRLILEVLRELLLSWITAGSLMLSTTSTVQQKDY